MPLFNIKRKEWKKHKYYTKVPTGKNSSRYFYSREEYLAYLNDKKKEESDQKINKPTSVNTNSLKDKVVNTLTKDNLQNNIDDKLSRLSKIGNDYIKKTSATYKIVSEDTTSDTAALISKIVGGAIGRTILKIINTKTRLVKEDDDQPSTNNKTTNDTKPTYYKTVTDSNGKTINFEDYESYRAWAKQSINNLPKTDKNYSNEEDSKMVNPNYSSGDYGYTHNCSWCSLTYQMRRKGYDVEVDSGDGETTADIANFWKEPTILYPNCTWIDDDEHVTTAYDGTEIQTELGTSIHKKEYEAYKAEFEQDQIDNLSKLNKLLYDKGLYQLDDPQDMRKWWNSKSNAEKWDMNTKYLIDKYGNGSSGVLNISWVNGGGHSVVWEIENNKVIVRDCQIASDAASCSASSGGSINPDGTYDMNVMIDHFLDYDFIRTDNLEFNEKEVLKRVSPRRE